MRGKANISLNWLNEQGIDIAMGGMPKFVDAVTQEGDTSGRALDSSEYDTLNFDLD